MALPTCLCPNDDCVGTITSYTFKHLDLQLHTTHSSGDLLNRPSVLGSVGQLMHTVDRHALSNCVMNN
jgi:hypothetical protein